MEIDYFVALDEKDLTEGTMKLVSVEGEPVLLIKQAGKIFAIDNRCPHMGLRLHRRNPQWHVPNLPLPRLVL